MYTSIMLDMSNLAQESIAIANTDNRRINPITLQTLQAKAMSQIQCKSQRDQTH